MKQSFSATWHLLAAVVVCAFGDHSGNLEHLTKGKERGLVKFRFPSNELRHSIRANFRSNKLRVSNL